MKSLSQIREASGDKEAYQKFFNKTLKKYGVTEPDQLSDKDKKKFYDEIDAGWEGDNEEPEPEDDVKESVELEEGKKVLAKKGDYAFFKDTRKDINYVTYKGKEIATGYFDQDSDAWWLDISDRKGEVAFDKTAASVVDYFIKKKITESVELDEGNISGVTKALASLATKPEYKKIKNALNGLANPVNKKDKDIAKGINKRLRQLATKVDKKAAAKLIKVADLAATYESVDLEEAVSVDMRTRGYKEAVKRGLLRQAKKEACGTHSKKKKKTSLEQTFDEITSEDVTTADVADAPKPLSIIKRKKKKEDA